MPHFVHIQFLWLLLIIPVLVVGFIIVTWYKRRQLKQLGDKHLINQLMPNASHVRPILKFTLEIIALCLIIIGLARPQWGETTEKIKTQEGIEIMIALDISKSMYAEDVKPNRLNYAKQMLSKIIDQRKNDRIGLVVYAGDAFVQLPITCDYVSAKMFLKQATPELINNQGTAIGQAIKTSQRAFRDPTKTSRVIILLTDGENHEDDACLSAKEAKENGIKVFVVGVGTPDGALIPIPGTKDYKKDAQKQPVVSKLNESMCKEIAKAGNGIYIRCNNTTDALQTLEKELDKLSTGEINTNQIVRSNEQYQSFVLIALLLLVIDFFIFTRKNKTLSKINLFNRHK